MPERRMFSNRIANSARFLQMPSDAQLLYFHMILRADDDGVVEAYPLIKLLGSPSDTIKILIAKNYIKQLNEDQVVIIMDWLEHNKIRADRKVNSIYQSLIHQVVPNIPLLNPKPRSDVDDNSKRVGGLSTDGIGKVRLGKVRLGKVRLESDVSLKSEITPSQEAEKFFFKNKNTKDEELKRFIDYWTELNKSGTKQRWQLEKTFEVKRRLNTWLSRANQFNKKNNSKYQVDL